jgi:hypothetical protein
MKSENGYGFSAYRYEPFERCLSDPGGSDGNTIFVRDSTAVETRLRGAPRYRLVNGEI